GRTTSSGRLQDGLSLCPSAAACQGNSGLRWWLSTNNVSMRVDFVAQDLKLQVAGRDRGSERLLDAQLEARRSPDLFETDAGVQTENFHPLGLFMITQDSQISDDPVRPRVGRQAGRFASAGAGQITRRGQEIELGYKPPRILIHDHQ